MRKYEYAFEGLLCKFCLLLLLLKHFKVSCATRKQNTLNILKCGAKLDSFFQPKFIWQMVWKEGFYGVKKTKKTRNEL